MGPGRKLFKIKRLQTTKMVVFLVCCETKLTYEILISFEDVIIVQNQALNATDIKLPWRQKFGWATGDFAQNLIYTTISTYLLFFYTNVYGLPAADAATMFLIVRLIDAINDPIVGTFIDKHTTRFGKYRGYLLYMGLPLAVLAMLCFYVPDFSQMGKLVYAYVTYVGLSVIYTTVNIPYGSLNAAMTRNNKELVSMSSIRMFLANMGSLTVSFGVPVCVNLWWLLLRCSIQDGLVPDDGRLRDRRGISAGLLFQPVD